MAGGGRRWPRIAALTGMIALAAGMLAVPGVAGPAVADPAASDTADTARDGTAPERAAGSCWAIKQRDSQAADGAYWVQTPSMGRPLQVFCDQTTDGGGWVLIGHGREGWGIHPLGTGDDGALTERTRTPSSFVPRQLSNAMVNDLLDRRPVHALDDGMRVVRARNTAGTAWQTVDAAFRDMTDFVWPFGAQHRLSRHRVDGGAWRSGGTFAQFGTGSSESLVVTGFDRVQKWHRGFRFGAASRIGAATSDSFVWRTAGSGGFPYAEAYLRPKVPSSGDAWARIEDRGTDRQEQRAIASSFASRTPWGVYGNLNGRTAEGNEQVQAFTQIGDTMFVGGNFTQVGRTYAGGERVDHAALAAFHAQTGQYRADFHPAFDGQVKALAVLPGGLLAVGGEFARVNGQPSPGFAVLDPATGQTAPGWDVTLENRLSGGRLSVKALAVTGAHLYLGGAFTHAVGPGFQPVYGKHAVRIDLASKRPDRAWNPEFNGSLMAVDVSPDGSRFYGAGFFTRASAGDVRKVAALTTSANPVVATPWRFQPSDPDDYQQAVLDGGGHVFVGGSEHSIQGYSRDALRLSSASLTMWNGGDFQALATDGSVVYGGCHCFDFALQGSNSYLQPGDSGTWRRADAIQGVGAWDAATGERIPSFTPYRASFAQGAGAWALHVADDGALWAGGDFTGTQIDVGTRQANGGFARFPRVDATAPATPTGLTASAAVDGSVTLSWEGVGDAVDYEVLRDDRTVAVTAATTVAVPAGGENRFFARAVDAAGNRSASTPVTVAGGGPGGPGSGTGDGSPVMLLAADSRWSYLHGDGIAPDGWTMPDFDSSNWPSATAPVGYGDRRVAEAWPAPEGGMRPITTFLRTTFDVDDPSRFEALHLTFVADDGAVVYLNGQEVARGNLNDGVVPGLRAWARSAVPTPTAWDNLITVAVPLELLNDGTNTIAASAHANYRLARNVTFMAQLSATPRPTASE